MSFPKPLLPAPRRRLLTGVALAVLACSLMARADLPPFLQHAIASSPVEAALYRLMSLPGLQALYPRPPKEAQGELASLIAGKPGDPELYALRAGADEQALDFAAAEQDWRAAAMHAKDPVAGQLQLADYEHRRLAVPAELAALSVAAHLPAAAGKAYTPTEDDRAREIYERLLHLAADQGLPLAAVDAIWSGYLTRLPQDRSLYDRYLQVLLARPDAAAAQALVARYRQAFPDENTFPLTASALIAYRGGADPAAALAIYDRSFDPLWDQTLVANYLTLLNQTHRAHSFLADAQARLARNPDDLNAMARIFYFYQQPAAPPAATARGTVPETQPRSLTLALQTLDRFRIAKEQRRAAWSPLDLYTLARLSALADSPSERARYDFALSAAPTGTLPGGEPAAQAGLADLIAVLLETPEQPFAVSSANLTLYRDIGTLDQGPGYWNGILSLWLNGTNAAKEYAAESAEAQPYFHRARAAELLADLDRRYPSAPERAALHAQLVHAEAAYGDPAVVLAAGKEFLASFPAWPDRTDIAGLTADAYARQKNTTAEFALYDAMLAEFAAKTGGQPLSASGATGQNGSQSATEPSPLPGDAGATPPEPPAAAALKPAEAAAFTLHTPLGPGASAEQSSASAQYAQTLERYLARLSATGQIPQALALLRRQLDANPNDPALYERLASFLEQNNLSAEQEQVYKQAIARFDPGATGDPVPSDPWYDRLARLYLRTRRNAEFAALTKQVTTIFSGTDLDRWFSRVSPAAGSLGPQLALQLDSYAEQRFPHDLVFTRKLLNAYTAKPTVNTAAWEALIRRHWWESPELRDQFFEYLSRTGKLPAETAQLNSLQQQPDASPAASRELAEADVWTTHYEQSAPLFDGLAKLYPADADLNDRAVSIFRSLAYLDPTPASTVRASAIQANLLLARPDSPDRLLTLGDLYAEATSTGGEDLQAAAPYWRCIPALHGGTPAGYLTAATVFWDYFQFDDALTELTAARRRFRQPTLYAYEAGAIEESRHDRPAAIHEYIASALHPPKPADAASAYDAAAGDAADTAEDAGSEASYGESTQSPAEVRLIQLVHRPASAALVDQATAAAVDADPNTAALSLRADVLTAENRSAELAPTLDRAISRAATAEQAAAIGTLAQTHALNPVYEHALQRQIALSLDPVEQIQLQLALARSYEDRHDVNDANRTIDTVYHANPRVLGVVRAAVDYDKRTAQPVRAVATLLEAAGAATPKLADSFTLEAAQTANAAGNTAQARALGNSLLAKQPYNPAYLAVVADSFARANDNAGLRDFYLARLEMVRADRTLAPDARKTDMALLRFGLIPALTRLGDDAGATDQYIALLSVYPEDAATAQQAALYALAHHREPQLLGFLQKTVHDSPRDARFAILLAQTEATFDDLPAALAAYSQAIAIRKDRADLYTARADLELRLDQPDAAADDYGRLYVLSYRDPSWMIRLAELRARQGRPADAVKALETAWITGRTPAAVNQFRVASSLERWNLLPEARTFAAQGVALAGPNLLVAPLKPFGGPDMDSGADAEDTTADASADDQTAEAGTPDASAYPAFSDQTSPNAWGAALYARILTRLGQPDEALITLMAARRTALAASPGLIASALQAAKLAPADQAHTRDDLRKNRAAAIDLSFNKAVEAMGTAIRVYGTPEAKLHFAKLLDAMPATPVRDRFGSASSTAIDAARAAGLADREAAYLRRALLAPGQTAMQFLQPYLTLGRSRLRFAELGATLEAYAANRKPEQRSGLLAQAADDDRRAGDLPNELRLERALVSAGEAGPRDRFFGLLLAQDPKALTALAANANGQLADAAANYAVAHGSEAQAFAALDARGKTLGTLWQQAETALTGLFFASSSSAREPAVAHRVDAAFRVSLGADASIGDRLAHPVPQGSVLRGDVWFPYGEAYGVYRETIPGSGDPEDFAAAGLEGDYAALDPYLKLARTYAEAAKPDQALAEYAHALELAGPTTVQTGAILDEQAELELQLNRVADAMRDWRLALNALAYQAERNSYGEHFWPTFGSICGHLHDAGPTPGSQTLALSPEIERVLRAYLVHNSNYRADELLRSAFLAAPSPAEGATLILRAASGIPEEGATLGGIDSAAWLPPAGREALLRRELELARTAPQTSAEVPSNASDALRPLQIRLERLLLDENLILDENRLPEAQALLATIPDEAPSTITTAPTGNLTAADQTEDDSCQGGDNSYTVCGTGAGDLVIPALRIELAVRTNQGPALVAGWANEPALSPSDATLDSALHGLELPTAAYQPDPARIRPLAEFAFERRRLGARLNPTAFLSLAELRLRTGDMPGALDLLHRLSVRPAVSDPAAFYTSSGGDYAAEDLEARQATPPDLYANTDSAARLLEATGHLPEALPFLAALVRGVPWDAGYRLRLAEAQLAVPASAAEGARTLLGVARDRQAAYALRLRAAERLRSAPAQGVAAGVLTSDGGSAELALVASPTAPTVAAASQAYFTAARLLAAAADHAAAGKLLRDALADDPAGPLSDRIRLALLQTELAAGHAEAATAVAEVSANVGGFSVNPGTSVDLTGQSFAAVSQSFRPDGQSAGDASGLSLPAKPLPTLNLPSYALTLDLPGRVALARRLAAAYEQEGDLATADADFQAVQAALPQPDPALDRHVLELRTAWALAARNAARRPVIRDALDAPKGATGTEEVGDLPQVRPRLLTLPPRALSQSQSQTGETGESQ